MFGYTDVERSLLCVLTGNTITRTGSGFVHRDA